ncbi:MAG: GDP-mannose 4,6-dehydratase [Candidatus Pelagibacter sp. TMED273]|nr:MAG: GDP-mannose 4,6-dehydratase [Candidatus Pelagibacter sp. TMED273]|tara:strand:+ start:2246 stop:3277 length:1032 start_codon:yes stop_codon:yes gene_type:complete
MSTAFITGITGQDGYYLTELLLSKGYTVHGTVRRSSTFNTSRIENLISENKDNGKLLLYYSDLLDSSSLNSLITKIDPDEVYNLAAQSHVAVSFENPVFTSQTGTLGPISILEAIRASGKKIKFYQASSSEMYGGASKQSLNEDSPFDPKSPYAASKVFAHNITKIYRDSYDMFSTNGILFNHESPYRGETFVTRKITRAVGRISLNLQSKLTLGNLEASRDWGFAGDYVDAMWKMMQHEEPSDWVIATGKTQTVQDFAKLAFEEVNLKWEDYVETSEKYFRPNEVEHLLGDSSKARDKLNWSPKTSFAELVKMMVNHDLELAKREQVLLKENLIKPTWENPT